MNRTNLAPTIAVVNCLPIQDNIPMLKKSVRQVLAAIHILIMSIGTPANFTVTYLIYRTKQYLNQSTRLIMYLSITDIFGVCIINGASALYMLSYEELSCPSLLVIHSFVNFAVSLTFMMIVGISFDRMLKVRYMNEYSTVFTSFRFKLALMCLSVVAGMQATLIFIGIYFLGYGYATILSVPVHTICVVATTSFYLISIKKLKDMNTISQRVSTSDRSIVKIATLYLIIFAAWFLPTLVWQAIFLSKSFSKVNDILIIFALYIWFSLQSTLNAFMFMLVNREARRVVISCLQTITRRVRSITNRLDIRVVRTMETREVPGMENKTVPAGIPEPINEEKV